MDFNEEPEESDMYYFSIVGIVIYSLIVFIISYVYVIKKDYNEHHQYYFDIKEYYDCFIKNISYTKSTVSDFTDVGVYTINRSDDSIFHRIQRSPNGFSYEHCETVTEQIQEKDNEASVVISYYKNANGENYIHYLVIMEMLLEVLPILIHPQALRKNNGMSRMDIR